MELERFACRQNNTPIERRLERTGNICAAAFTHDASRALDPQLHTHFVIANATRGSNGRWYALSEYEMVKAVRYAGTRGGVLLSAKEISLITRETRSPDLKEVTTPEVHSMRFGTLTVGFQSRLVANDDRAF